MALVNRVTGDCPKCQAKQSYGVVDVHSDHITFGCWKCPYLVDWPLPPIRKRLLYLDQSFFSHAFRAKEPRFAEAAKRINKFTAMQLLAVPYSDIHERETRQLTQHDEALFEFVKSFSRGHQFVPPYDVEHTQIADAFRSFSKGEVHQFDFRREDVLEDRIDVWDGYYRIDVKGMVKHDWAAMRAAKAEELEGLLKLLDGWRTSTNSFEIDVALEDDAAAQQYLTRYTDYIRRLVEGDPTAMAFSHIDSLVVERMWGSFPEDLPPSERVARLHEFFSTEHFRNVPFRYLASRMYATLKRRVVEGAYGNKAKARNVLSGFYADVEHIATYAPYCDAIVVDRAMAEMVKRPTVGLTEKFGTQVFSRTNWDDFLAWLDEIEASASEEHMQTLRLAYPAMDFEIA